MNINNNIYLSSQKAIKKEQNLIKNKAREREKQKLLELGMNEEDSTFYSNWGRDGREKLLKLYESGLPRNIFLFCVNKQWSVSSVNVNHVHPILFESFEEAYDFCLEDFTEEFDLANNSNSHFSFEVSNLDNTQNEVVVEGIIIKKLMSGVYRKEIGFKYTIAPVAFFINPNSRLLISKNEKEKQIYEF